MLKYSSSAFFSMLRSSQRAAGRSWFAEFMSRTFKTILSAPENDNLPRLRKIIEAVGVYHSAISKVDIAESKIANVPCLVFTPRSPSNTVIVYLHGGGYVFGSPKGYKALLAQFCLNNQATVIGVDYRLSPEHPYPAAQDDCLLLTQTVFAEHSGLKKIIAGDSAGGALSIATALALAGAGQGPTPDACVLISPWVDPLADDGSMITNKANDFLTTEFLQKSIDHHMQGTAPTARVRFNEVDLAALPPTLVQSGAAEVFDSQITEFVSRARAAGVTIEHQVSVAQFHVFQLFSPVLKEARIAVKKVATFIDSI